MLRLNALFEASQNTRHALFEQAKNSQTTRQSKGQKEPVPLPEPSQGFTEGDVHLHDQIHSLTLELKPGAWALTDDQDNISCAFAKLLIGLTMERNLKRGKCVCMCVCVCVCVCVWKRGGGV